MVTEVESKLSTVEMLRKVADNEHKWGVDIETIRFAEDAIKALHVFEAKAHGPKVSS